MVQTLSFKNTDILYTVLNNIRSLKKQMCEAETGIELLF